ncbi:MAG: hypothetical protein V1838_01705 [Patescibacteria group bacterium]
MTKPDPIEMPDYHNSVVLLRVAVVAIILIFLGGVGYYSVYYFNKIFFPKSDTTTTAHGLTLYQMRVNVRTNGTYQPIPNADILVEEYGQPANRNLVTTSTTSNVVGTATLYLPRGQYTIRPSNGERWSGLATIKLYNSQEITLILTENE